MLANAIAVIIFQCKYMNHIKVRYALNLHSVICQLYLSKAEKKKSWNLEMTQTYQ